MAAEFATIGHSNRDFDTVIAMLRDAQIGVLVDVRSFPRSRSNPVFNTDTLPDALAPFQIGYAHFPDLGGRRKKQPEVDDAVNAMWRVRSFHNYADYALSDPFTAALERLIDLGQTAKPCLMCAEAVWWRCHRRLITDNLLARGHSVDHLMGEGRVDAAQMTPGAVVTDGGRVVYPAPSE